LFFSSFHCHTNAFLVFAATNNVIAVGTKRRFVDKILPGVGDGTGLAPGVTAGDGLGLGAVSGGTLADGAAGVSIVGGARTMQLRCQASFF